LLTYFWLTPLIFFDSSHLEADYYYDFDYDCGCVSVVDAYYAWPKYVGETFSNMTVQDFKNLYNPKKTEEPVIFTELKIKPVKLRLRKCH